MLLSLCLQCWQGWVTWNRSSDGSLKMFQAADLSLGRISATCVWRLFQRPTCVRKNCYFFYVLLESSTLCLYLTTQHQASDVASHSSNEGIRDGGGKTGCCASVSEINDEGGKSRTSEAEHLQTHLSDLMWKYDLPYGNHSGQGAFAWSKDTVCSDIIHHCIKNPKY